MTSGDEGYSRRDSVMPWPIKQRLGREGREKWKDGLSGLYPLDYPGATRQPKAGSNVIGGESGAT
jgi:hypothetical protein